MAEVASSAKQERRKFKSIHDLPDFLLIEILHRLPCKSAHQCKCVSKHWYSSISSPYFISRFLSRKQIENGDICLRFAVFLYYYAPPLRKELAILSKDSVFESRGFTLSFLPCFKAPENIPITVIGSYNDLLLCCSTDLTNQRVYYICNPLTLQWIELPPAPHCHKYVLVGFIYDPFCTKDVNGEIKINVNKRRFKLVRIPHDGCGTFTSFNVETFSSETSKWSESTVSCSPQGFSIKMGYINIYGTVYNGRLHWWNHDKGILAYDPHIENSNQRCRFIDQPTDLIPGGQVQLFGVSKGCLRICQVFIHYIGLWELEDYNVGKWKLVHKVYLHEMKSEDSWLQTYVKSRRPNFLVLRLHTNDGDTVYLSLPGRIALCNMKGKTLKLVWKGPDAKDITQYEGKAFSIVLPWWPTPVPSLP